MRKVQSYVVASIVGAVLGLAALFLLAIGDAHFPNIPRPSCYWSGTGTLSYLQDELMDREIALYALGIFADRGVEFAACSAAVACFLLDVFKECQKRFQIYSCLEFLKRCIRHRYFAAGIVGIIVGTLGAFVGHSGFLFLLLSWSFDSHAWLDFTLCGVLILVIIDQLRWMKMRKHASAVQLWVYSTVVFILCSVEVMLWPCMIHPVAEHTCELMQYGHFLTEIKYFGCAPACGLIESRVAVPELFDGTLFLFLIYVGIEVTVQVFKPKPRLKLTVTLPEVIAGSSFLRVIPYMFHALLMFLVVLSWTALVALNPTVLPMLEAPATARSEDSLTCMDSFVPNESCADPVINLLCSENRERIRGVLQKSVNRRP